MTSHLSSFSDVNFRVVAPGVGAGDAPDTTWQSIAAVPLVILVGVTGVGKSTTLRALRDRDLPFQLLPDRRELTDQLIISFLQHQDGAMPHPVTDRTERFALTRRYRAQFPGGMSHALSCLLLQNDSSPQPIVDSSTKLATWWFFDGLRGANEVQAAAELLPAAHFIVLDAPDVVRVTRLVGRNDRFDQVAMQSVSDSAPATAQNFAAIGVPEADAIFSAHDRAALLALCEPPLGQSDVTVDNLRAKLTIVAEERRNYDPTAALQTLLAVAPNRTLVIDTTKVSVTAAALQIMAWLNHH